MTETEKQIDALRDEIIRGQPTVFGDVDQHAYVVTVIEQFASSVKQLLSGPEREWTYIRSRSGKNLPIIGADIWLLDSQTGKTKRDDCVKTNLWYALNEGRSVYDHWCLYIVDTPPPFNGENE